MLGFSFPLKNLTPSFVLWGVHWKWNRKNLFNVCCRIRKRRRKYTFLNICAPLASQAAGVFASLAENRKTPARSEVIVFRVLGTRVCSGLAKIYPQFSLFTNAASLHQEEMGILSRLSAHYYLQTRVQQLIQCLQENKLE